MAQCYLHIGDSGTTYAGKRVGEEHLPVEGWTEDWRLVVEWLADEADRMRSSARDRLWRA